MKLEKSFQKFIEEKEQESRLHGYTAEELYNLLSSSDLSNANLEELEEVISFNTSFEDLDTLLAEYHGRCEEHENMKLTEVVSTDFSVGEEERKKIENENIMKTDRYLTSEWAYSPTDQKNNKEYPSPDGEIMTYIGSNNLYIGKWTEIENNYKVITECIYYPIINTPQTKREYIYALACLKQKKKLVHNELISTSLPVAVKLPKELTESLNKKAFNINFTKNPWILIQEIEGYDMHITNLKGDKHDTISSKLWGWG